MAGCLRALGPGLVVRRGLPRGGGPGAGRRDRRRRRAVDQRRLGLRPRPRPAASPPRSSRPGWRRCPAAATTSSTSAGSPRSRARPTGCSRRSIARGATSRGAPCTARSSSTHHRLRSDDAAARPTRRRPSRPAKAPRARRSSAGCARASTATTARAPRAGCRPICAGAACRRASARSVRCAAAAPAPQAWVRQLCWRDFFAHVLLHEHPVAPEPAVGARRRAAGRLAGRDAPGFPLVDAGMRQLAATGWMHNRAADGRRLVPDQGPAPRLARGRAALRAAAARRRADAEQRQLAVGRLGRRRPGAGVPADLQPDAAGPEVRSRRRLHPRWVPELARLPTASIHDPSPDERRACGYPEPVVDHRAERRRALERYSTRGAADVE